jgi:hypothetical protein
MAYVHEIKFFLKNNQLQAALFDHPAPFCSEFWIKNVKAEEIGIKKLPENIKLEKKYKVEDLGIKPFSATKPEFDFLDGVAKFAWENGTNLVIGSFFK